MAKILLLYDTREKDLARDFSDLLLALECEVAMIPREPDGGGTLEEKENHNFKGKDGAVFLITHGSDRGDAKLPSPSVAEEMGRAKTLFESAPGRVVYLVDQECSPQAIDQKAYISFNRHDIRSVLDAVTRLIVNLKAAGLVVWKRPESVPQSTPAPAPEIDEMVAGLELNLVTVVDAISHQPNGIMNYREFHQLLKQMGLDNQASNFVKRDLAARELVRNHTDPKLGLNCFVLLPLGWQVARYFKERNSKDLEKSLLATTLLARPPRSASSIGAAVIALKARKDRESNK